jgi:large subunit ribosomal protein L21
MSDTNLTKKEAVIRVGGTQYVVHEGEQFEVNKLSQKPGNKFDAEVLLSSNGKEVEVGFPQTKNAKVSLEVISHKKGEKIDGMRFKAKARYRRRYGFRASLTVLKVTKIA